MRRQNALFEEVTAFNNLYHAAQRAMRGKKARTEVATFYFHLEREIIKLREELLTGSYRPQAYTIFEIQDPKVRQICSSRFRDRVVHHALCDVLEPYFERRLIFDTYACRLGKGSHAAIKRCQSLVRGNEYFLKCDIKKFFETMDHAVLRGLLHRMFKDTRLLALVEKIIDHPVPGAMSNKGIPIGNLTSQHFANLYLGELDHFIKERLRIKGYVRYMDDFIVFNADKRALREALYEIRTFLSSRLKLDLKEKAIRIAPVTEGVPFLGMKIFGRLIRILRPNLIRFRKNMKKTESDYRSGKISQEHLICSMQSRIAHLSYANTLSLRRREFDGSIGLA